MSAAHLDEVVEALEATLERRQKSITAIARVMLQVEAEAHYSMARRFAALGFDLHAMKEQAEAARLSRAERNARIKWHEDHR